MKTLIKRCCCILMALFMTILFSPKSYADVIAEPYGDEFYETHMNEMRYINKEFYVNAPDGDLAVYKSPVDYTIVKTLKNGEQVYISHEYTDSKGNAWCVIDSYMEGITGWILEEYLYERFSEKLFRAQYITELSGPVSVDLSELSTVYLYETPGSSAYYEMGASSDGPFEKFESAYSFVDSEGRTWAYVSYYYGYRDLFIYADHPDMKPEEVMKDGFSSLDKRGEFVSNVIVSTDEETETETEVESMDEIRPLTEPDVVVEWRERRQRTIILAGVLVGSALLISVTILVLILRKKKK